MKCFLCKFKSNNSVDITKQCYNVDQINQFFVKLFKNQNNVVHGQKCLRCNEFLPSSCFKVYHDILVHYDAGKNVFEEKPISYTNFGKIQKYKITFTQHFDDCDFFNAEKLVDKFLLNVKNRVGRSNSDFFIKCGFSLENIQPLPIENN